ncbi:hypothetical protein AB1Y20_017191, partial [Prymnesium parvum]
MLGDLLAAAADPDASVRLAASDSVVRLGLPRPELALAACAAALRPQHSEPHRTAVLSAAARLLPSSSAAAAEAAEAVAAELVASRSEAHAAAALACAAAVGEAAPAAALAALAARVGAAALPARLVLRALGELVAARPAVCVGCVKTELLPRLLPLLGSAQGAARVELAAALRNFSTGIVAAAEQRDAQLPPLSFSVEMQAAIELLYAQWLGARDDEVRAAAAEAIGSMFALLLPSQLQDMAPRMLSGLLAAQRREPETERLPFTQAIWALLTALEATGEDQVIRSCAESVYATTHALHASVCAPVDRTSSALLRNHNEELRCVEALCRLFPEVVVAYLLRSLADDKEPPALCGTLECLRHLAQRLDLDAYQAAVVAGVEQLLPERTYRVRSSLAQLIGCLAGRGKLHGEAAAPSLVLFLVRQAAISDGEIKAAEGKSWSRSSDADAASELRDVSSKTLELLAKTVPSMRPMLWALLLDCLMQPVYQLACPIICRCLLRIGDHFASTSPADLALPMASCPSLRSVQAVYTRLISLACALRWKAQLAATALRLLLLLAPQLHPALAARWGDIIPKLLSYLKAGSGDSTMSSSAKLSEWAQLCQHFQADSLDAISATEGGRAWIARAQEETLASLQHTEQAPPIVAALLVQLAPLLRRATEPSHLPAALSVMLGAVRHGDGAVELAQYEEGGACFSCAVGFGGAAAVHFSLVVDELNLALQTLLPAAPTSVSEFFHTTFLNTFVKPDRPPLAVEADAATIALAAGLAAAAAPPSLLEGRVELLMNALLAPARTAKSECYRSCFARAVDEMAKALAPAAGRLTLSARDETVEILRRFATAALRASDGHASISRLSMPALHACSVLIGMQPPPSRDVTDPILQATLDLMELKYSPVEDSPSADDTALQAEVLAVCNQLLASLVSLQQPQLSVVRLLAVVLPLSRSASPQLRLRSVDAAARLLAMSERDGLTPPLAEDAEPPIAEASRLFELWKAFTAPSTSRVEVNTKDIASAVGGWIGLALPRVADPDAMIRQRAASALLFLLRLAASMTGQTSEGTASDAALHALHALLERAREVVSQSVAYAELEPRLAVQQQLVTIIEPLLLPSTRRELARCLVSGLGSEWHGAAAACVALDRLLQTTSSADEVAEVLSLLLEVLPSIEEEIPRHGALTVGSTLARCSMEGMMRCLLNQPPALSSQVTDYIQRLVRDEHLLREIIPPIAAAMAERGDDADAAEAAAAASTATALLGSIMRDKGARLGASALVASVRPALLSALAARLGSFATSAETRVEPPLTSAVRAFVECLGEGGAAGEGSGGGGGGEAAAARGGGEESMAARDGVESPGRVVAPTADFTATLLLPSGCLASRSAPPDDAEPASRPVAPSSPPPPPASLPARSAGGGEDEAPLDRSQLLWALGVGRVTRLEVVRSLVQLCVDARESPREIFEQLLPHTRARTPLQRELAAAAIAQIAAAGAADVELCRHALHALLRQLEDAEADVRLQALYGLSRLAARGFAAALQPQLESLLAALLARPADARVSHERAAKLTAATLSVAAA